MEDDKKPLPINGQDVQNTQNLGIVDKFNMVRSGLDPGKADHVAQYLAQKKQGYADGGMVSNMMPPQPPIQAPGPQMQTQPMPQMDQQKQMQMDALRKLRGI